MADTSTPAAAFNADGSANTAAITAMMEGYGAAQGRSAADLASTEAGDAAYWVPKVAAGGPAQLAYFQSRMADKPGQGTNAGPAAQAPQFNLPTVSPSLPPTGSAGINSTGQPVVGGQLGQVNSAANQAAINAALSQQTQTPPQQAQG
jgi:hypothetical protein